MAQFQNPIRTRTGGSVPRGTFQMADFSGAVESIFDFGEEQVIRSRRGDVAEAITEEAEAFTSVPERATELQRLSQEIRQEEASRMPPAQNERSIRRMKNEMRRLSQGLKQGAMSSGEVRMRADQITRQAIADNPSIADELIQQRNQTLGLFESELQFTDSLLGQDEDDQAAALLQQQNKQIVELANKYGLVVTDFSQSNINRIGRQVMNIEGTANALDTQAQAAGDRQTIAENVASDTAQMWVQREFLQARGRIENVLQSDLSQEEKTQAINDAIAQLRTNARSHKIIGQLPPDRLDSIVAPAVDRLEQAKSVISGEVELASLKNQWDSMVYQNVIRSASENPGILSTATASKFGGEIVGELVSQQVGIADQTETLIDSAVRVISDERKVPNPDMDKLDRLGVFDRYFQKIAAFRDLDVPVAEAQDAAKQLVTNLIPEEGADLTEMQLEKWHKALPILARTDVRDMFEATGMNQRQLERLNNRTQQYIDTQLVPNLRSRLVEPMVRTREALPQPEGVQQAMAQGSNIVETSVINFVDPVWTSDGTMRLETIPSELPEQVRNDPSKMRTFREKVERLNNTYVPIWNNAMKTSANFSFSDAKMISETEWQDQFGDLKIEETEGTENE